MASSITDNRRLYDEKISEIEKLSESFVLVGFQLGDVTKSQIKNGRRKEAGKVMAQIAAENEFGTKTIPARSFMRTSFDENRQRIIQIINSEYNKIIQGTSTIRRSLTLIGLFVEKTITDKIDSIHFPPNSPRTIAIKKSSKPLIDFGQMRQSVTQKVVIP